MMDVIAAPLSKHFKVITYDCRRHGASGKPPSYTLTDHANDTIGIIDHFQLESVYLLGASMGSYIAQQVAFTIPERIEKLVLTVPKTNGLISSLERILKENNYNLIDLGHHEITLKLLPHLAYNQEVMLQHLVVLETTLSQDEFAAAGKALAAFDFRRNLSSVTAETLVISGKHDQLNPPAMGRECAGLLPHATYIEMSNSGHIPMFEEQEKYLKILEDFLG